MVEPVILGDCTLYLGDCLEVLPTFPDACIDLTVTSPPYDNLRTYNGYLGAFKFEPIAQELYRVTKPGGVVVWVVGDATINGSETGNSFRQALYFIECGFNLHDTMIYAASRPPLNHKRYEQEFDYMFIFSKGKEITFNGLRIELSHWTKMRLKYPFYDSSSFQKYPDNARKIGKTKRDPEHQRLRGNIWYYKVGINKEMTSDEFARQHPAPFPEELAKDHILSWSNPGDTVLDCMMGSGTTGKMAAQNGRKFIGCEIVPEYFEIACKRIEKAQEAIRMEI